jgi:hypothetical protein
MIEVYRNEKKPPPSYNKRITKYIEKHHLIMKEPQYLMRKDQFIMKEPQYIITKHHVPHHERTTGQHTIRSSM